MYNSEEYSHYFDNFKWSIVYKKLNHYVSHLKLILQINYTSIKRILKSKCREVGPSGGIGWGDHFLPHKFIKRLFEC